jgi:DNA-directed RNA polymerase specialized sigma subunit
MRFAAVSTSARAPLRFAGASSFVYSFLVAHYLIDRRSLELNRRVAEKIRQQPELMDLVRNRLERTLSGSRLSESSKDALREWQTILSTHSLNEALAILTEDSDGS